MGPATRVLTSLTGDSDACSHLRAKEEQLRLLALECPLFFQGQSGARSLPRNLLGTLLENSQLSLKYCLVPASEDEQV